MHNGMGMVWNPESGHLCAYTRLSVFAYRHNRYAEVVLPPTVPTTFLFCWNQENLVSVDMISARIPGKTSPYPGSSVA